MSNLLRKLVELDDLKNEDEIANVVKNLTDEKISSAIKGRLVDNLAPRCIGIILDSYTRTNEEKKKLQLIRAILEEIPKQAALTAVQTRDLTYAILSDLESLETGSLVKLVDFCINLMQSNERSKECWKEILPRLLLILREKPVVNHCGHDMSGADYRSQVVKSLCNAEWKPENITMIAAMFRELPMVGEEFKQVVDKLLDGMDELEASEVPPFVYQMLRLCGHQFFLLVLMHAQRYFQKHTVRTLEPDMDSIEAVETSGRGMSAELKQSESTVLFHIQKCAAQDPQSSKNLSSSLQNLVFAPEILFGKSNFLLSATLMICEVATVREKFLLLLVNSFVRSVQDEELLRKHPWTSMVLESQNKLEPCLKGLIESTDIQRGVVLEQLVKFCFEVLLSKRSGRCADMIQNTASNTLMIIAKKQPDSISVILELLVNNITGSKFEPHLLRCLKRLIAMTQVKLLTKTEFISMRMVEQLVNMQPATAEQSIMALMPLLSRSEGLCNNLVVNLRKAINRPLPETKQMAVTGLLTIIQRLKVKKFMGGSQFTQFSSNSSLSSQVSAEVTHYGIPHSKDLTAVNLELIQILTPALFCQAEVRLRLYEGIHCVPSQNASLAPVVLHLLNKNLAKCKDLDGTGVLDYGKCYMENMEEEVVLLEPLGHLVFSFAMVLCQMKASGAEENLIEEHEAFMDALINRMAQVTVSDLGYDKDQLVIDEGPKGEKKVLVLTLAMTVCEAVIGYLIRTWADSKEQLARKALSVFNTFTSIQDHIKGCKRPTKKKDANQTVAGSQNVNPRKRGRPAAGSSNLSKEKGCKEIGGVAIPTVLDLPTICLALQVLYCENEWAEKNQASLLQNKMAFKVWVLSTLNQAINHYKVLSGNGVMEKTSPEFTSFCVIGNILLSCVSKVKDMAEDSPEMALLLMETLAELFSLFHQDNPLMLEPFVATVGNGDAEESVVEIVPKLMELVSDMVKHMYEKPEDIEAAYKKIPKVAITIAHHIIPMMKPKSKATEEFVSWMQFFVRNSACSDESIVKAMLELLLVSHAMVKRSSGAARALAIEASAILSHIEEDDNQSAAVERKMSLVADEHSGMLIQVTCSHIRELLEVANVMVQRLKSERCLQPFQVNNECAHIVSNVEEKEMVVCNLVLGVIDVVRILLSTQMNIEQGEALLRDVCFVYRTVANLCKHFSRFCTKGDQSYRRSKFPMVVSTAGKVLPPIISTFISYLEEKQRVKYAEMQGKKKFNAKVAQKRVLRESDTFARTILEFEKFSKSVFQLSAKVKDPSLKDCLNLGASYDFRINYGEVEKKLKALRDEDDEQEESAEDEEMEED